jgi:hypothetical protein
VIRNAKTASAPEHCSGGGGGGGGSDSGPAVTTGDDGGEAAAEQVEGNSEEPEDPELRVNSVASARQSREAGRSQQMTDDIEYLLQGLGEKQPTAVRIPSVLKLAKNSLDLDFRMHLKAHGFVSQVLLLLNAAHTDEPLSMVAAALMVVLARDPQFSPEPAALRLLLALFSTQHPHAAGATGGSMLARKKRQLRQKQRNALATKVKAVLDDAALKHPFSDTGAVRTAPLALEAMGMLLSTCAKTTFVQDELRLSGCIEKVVLSTRGCVEALTVGDDLGHPDCAAAVLLERHLRVLHGAVRKNEGNQSYMACGMIQIWLRSLHFDKKRERGGGRGLSCSLGYSRAHAGAALNPCFFGGGLGLVAQSDLNLTWPDGVRLHSLT